MAKPEVLLIIAVPLTTLLFVACAYQLIHSQNHSERDVQIQRSLEQSETIYKLVLKLQVERGITCVYLTERKWYTSEINSLISKVMLQLQSTEDGKLWSSISGYHAMIIASDLLGLKRAKGAAVVMEKSFDSSEAGLQFAELSGSAAKLLEFGKLLSSSEFHGSKMEYLQSRLDNMQEAIYSGFKVRPLQTPENVTSKQWFNNHTSYIEEVARVETEISSRIVITLRERIYKTQIVFYFVMAIVIIVGSVCTAMATLSCKKLQKVLLDIHCLTEELEKKTLNLLTEQSRMEDLVNELLPKSIAEDIKNRRAVRPRSFEKVTIFYGEIFAFAELTQKCTPFEVVNILNILYTRCDEILDRYDVYKVQTAGDAYIVVSGCPKRNGKAHSKEISAMALEILCMIEGMSINIRTQKEPLLMRIGIHTGRCATGVVGAKMPRYCVFGDSVCIAQQIKQLGEPMQIHISGATKEHLDANFSREFRTEPTGKYIENLDGKVGETCWLIGKVGHSFHVNVDASFRKVSQATYWKKISSQAD